ncbi:MAG TPA: hypothetical protein VFV86_05620 [Nitrososphaeraceae archaeon]|nr:hypothetical protein [Nitrososphaeraceae archaeon]
MPKKLNNQKPNNEIIYTIEGKKVITHKSHQETVNTIQSLINKNELQNTAIHNENKTVIDNDKKKIGNDPSNQQKQQQLEKTTRSNISNITNRINEFVLESTENLNKSIEITQKYHDENVQNYINL